MEVLTGKHQHGSFALKSNDLKKKKIDITKNWLSSGE